ncbi:MAG TPA: MFS transporter [Gaiellaceae bacterium]|nr:MFS transporter [Gaiellaceae bacterium]
MSLRSNRNFRLLWIGQILSDIGSQIGSLAYPLLVLALTRSALLAGVVGTTASASAFAVRLPAGALADRLDRRRTMMAADAARALALGLLAALVLTHAVSWPVVLAVAIVDRTTDTLFTPASIAALPLIVPDEQLEAAWAVSEGRQYAANIAGPPLGGLLYGIGRAVPFLADAVSYAISVVTSRALRGDFSIPPAEEERRGLWSESFEGIKALWRDRLLRAVLIQAPLINFAVGGVIFTVIIGLRKNGVSALVIGAAEAVIMLGGVAGAFAAPWIRERVTIRQAILLITVSESLAALVAAGVMPSPAVALPLALPLVIAPASNAALFGLVLRRTPPALHGRVNNGLLQVATGLATLAPLASGVVVNDASARWAMVLFAVSLVPVLPMAFAFPAQDEPAEPTGPS